MLDGAATTHPETAADPVDPATLWAVLTHALSPAAGSRTGTSVWFAFVAPSVGDPWIAERLAEAKRGVAELVADCLRAQHPGLDDDTARGHARTLLALSDGATQAVYLGWLDADAARTMLRAAVDGVATR